VVQITGQTTQTKGSDRTADFKKVREMDETELVQALREIASSKNPSEELLDKRDQIMGRLVWFHNYTKENLQQEMDVVQ
jgi:hypothetical protein